MKTIFFFCLMALLLQSNCMAQQAAPYSVVISEIFADPTPPVSLPEKEWVELHNVSDVAVDLQNWKIGDASGLSGSMPAYILKPDSFVIICTASSVSSLNVFGNVLAVTSFPSLANDDEVVWLRAANSTVVHAIHYTDDWYQNELKKAGGWSLEMIDAKNPCGGITNWRASTDITGGTPGRKNAVAQTNHDEKAPQLKHAFANTPISITLSFNEPVDSARAIDPNCYSISDGIGKPVTVTPVGPLYDRVNITLATPLTQGKIYIVTVTSLTDCCGNIISPASNSVRVGIVGQANPFDIVVNEILFNPIPAAADYVELYNRSNKIIDLKNLYLANRTSANAIGSIVQISAEPYSLFPGDFIVATQNSAAVKNVYVSENPEAFIDVTTPSYNDDKGSVVLLNEQGTIVDEIDYEDDWHFPLISNAEGVALERLDYNDTSFLPDKQRLNWHSAATSVGYGTPGYRNSQFVDLTSADGTIIVEPKIISPDNDGRDDVATITYNFHEPGYVVNITIFDASGRPVRILQRNSLCGTKGFFRWDGLNEKRQYPASGIYIIYTEAFDLKVKVKRFKNSIVVGRR